MFWDQKADLNIIDFFLSLYAMHDLNYIHAEDIDWLIVKYNPHFTIVKSGDAQY